MPGLPSGPVTNVSLEGLHTTLMLPRVKALIADPDFAKFGMAVVSAFRSDAYQAQLYQAAIKEYGSAQAAGKWVAPPGHSRHGPRVDGMGMAVDLSIIGETPWRGGVKGQFPDAVEARINAICARHGLASPMDWEDWHFEPIPNWVAPAAGQPAVVPKKEVAPLFSPAFLTIDALPTPSGKGCWLLGPDGSVGTVGDAAYLGGMNTPVNLHDFTGHHAARIQPRDDGQPGYQIVDDAGHKYVPKH